jgi:hypothetical protein
MKNVQKQQQKLSDSVQKSYCVNLFIAQVCPMCEATFSLEVRQEEFEQHVLQHFRYISGRFVTRHIELGRNVML